MNIHDRCLDCNFHKIGQSYKECEQHCFYKEQMLQQSDNKILKEKVILLEEENAKLNTKIQEMLKDLEITIIGLGEFSITTIMSNRCKWFDT